VKANPLQLTAMQRAELWRCVCELPKQPRCNTDIALVRYELASAGLIMLKDGLWVGTPMGKAAI